MKKPSIKEIFEFLNKSKFKASDGKEKGGFPFYTSSEAQTKFTDKPIYPRGCLVFGTGGKANIHLSSTKFATSADCIIIRPKDTENVKVDYYHQFFKANPSILEKGFKGAGLKHISKEYISNIRIPLPKPDEQIRIAKLLSRVEELIATRKDNLRLLDEFLKSTFLEMFGNPVRNEKSWITKPLEKLARIERGRFSPRPRNDPKFYGGLYPFIQTGDINRSNGRLSVYSQTLNEMGIKVSKEFKKGTVVIAIVGATIGETAVLQIDTYATDSVIGITPISNEIDSVYLEYLLRFWKPVIKANAPEAARANINIETLKPLKIIIPAPDLLKQFFSIEKKAESLKNHYQQNLTELENLFGALSQKAFKGELDLSRIPLHHKTLAEFENNQDEVVITANGVVPEDINTTLANLNEFNQSATSLKAIESAARISSFNPAEFDSVKQAAAQIAAFRSPLEQLKNMSSIASAMAQIESVIKPLNLTQFDSISSSVELARNMASAITKIDMSWLEQHNDALKYAAAHFESMRSTMARIESLNYDRIDSIAKRMESAAIPRIDTGLSDQYRETLRKMTDPFGDIRNAVERASASSIYTQHLETAKWLQSTIPDFTSLQRLTSNPLGMYLDNEAVYTKLQFHHEDVIDILDNAGLPLSFESLMQQLEELETVDFAGYETIKAILFDLLAGNLVMQVFDEKEKIMLFALVENGLEQ